MGNYVVKETERVTERTRELKRAEVQKTGHFGWQSAVFVMLIAGRTLKDFQNKR